MPKSILSTSRLSSIALVALASFLPVATGCTQQATWAPSPTDRGAESGAPTQTPAPIQAGIPTSSETLAATGMAYFTETDTDTATIFQGFYPDGSPGSSVTLGGDDTVLTADFQDPGRAPQHLTLSVDPSSSGTGINAAIDGQSLRLTVDADGNVSGPDAPVTGAPSTNAILLMLDASNHQMHPAGSTIGTAHSRWYACIVCGGAAVVIAAGIYFLYSSGFGGAVITSLFNAYRLGGNAAVLAVITKIYGNLTPDQITKILAVVAALTGAGLYVLNQCIQCATGEAGGVAQGPAAPTDGTVLTQAKPRPVATTVSAAVVY